MRTTHQADDIGTRLYQGAPEFRQWRDSFLTRFNELLPDRPEVKGQTAFRTVTLDHTRAQKDQRTIEAILATGADVMRRGYVERLDMSAAAVNLERAADLGGLPLLWNHDPSRHLGFAENVRIHDGALRTRLKFADSDEALEKWRGVEDGTLRSLSIGYQIEDEEWQERGAQGFLVTAKRWTPLEGSVVTIPADTKARIGRSLDAGLLDTPPPEFAHLRRQRELLRQLDIATWAAEEEDGIDGVLERAREAVMLAQDDQGVTRAQEALRELDAAVEAAQAGTHVSGVRSNMDDDYRQVTTKPNHLSKRRTHMKQQYSICRALAAQIDPASAARAGFEIELDQEMRNRTGRSPQGMLVPDTAILGRSFNKATEGADLVSQYLYSSAFIEALRPRMVTGRLGATILEGLRADVKIPRKTGDVTAYWIAGDGADAITESDPTTDNITLSPKTVGARTIISRKMLIQAEPAAEQMVSESIVTAIRQAIDKQAMVGDGSGNTPTGILNVSGIGSKEYANGGAPDFEDVVDLEGELMADDADFGSLGYVAHTGIATTLKKTPVVSGQDRMIWTATGEGEGRLNGYRAMTSNNLSSGFLVFGNWSDLLIGYWSGLDFVVDPHTRAAYGDVIVTCLVDLDVKVRHPESFAELKEAAS
jgi:HK97 family phage major capsid protein/HK97 family phage prohead protease